MAVKYICGRAGSGKSNYILGDIKKEIEADKYKKMILIVPEQYTLQAERDLINYIEKPGIINIEVLSISRIADRVFKEVGGLTRTILNEHGKSIILRKIIEENEKELSVYKKSCKQYGFIEKLGELISDMKQRNIGQELLQNQVNELDENPLLKGKFSDISLLYEKFNSFLDQKYLDTDDYHNMLIEKLEHSSLIKDSLIWIDGFSTYSPQTIRIIQKTLELAQDIDISFTIDLEINARDFELFDLSHYALKHISAYARQKGIKEEWIELKARDNKKSPAIKHLESEIFAFPYKKFNTKSKDLEIISAINTYEEVEIIAKEIVALIRGKGYRWKELALVCNNMSTYTGMIKRVFNEYQIPFFIDDKREILNNPIVLFITSSLDILSNYFRYEDISVYLKSGFTNLSGDEIELLDNYIYRFNIKGSKWKSEFKRGESEDLISLNHSREKLITPLLELESNLKAGKCIRGYVLAYFKFLLEFDLINKINVWVEDLRAEKRYDIAAENAQIWNILMDILDQLVKIMGEQKVSVKEFKQLLETGLSSVKLGIIPTTLDQLLVGSIQRSISQDIKALIIIGVNDGVLPSNNNDEDLLSSEEKQLLEKKGLNIGYSQDMKNLEENFLIYNAIAKPREKILMSYALADIDGKALRTSLLLERIKKIYPQIPEKSLINQYNSTAEEQVSIPSSSFKFLLEKLRNHIDGKKIDESWWDVYSWYYQQESWHKFREMMIQALYHNNQEEGIAEECAQKIYKTPFSSSISRIENFVRCPYSHFIRYGLKPVERKEYEIQRIDIGEILHNFIYNFSQKVEDSKIDWRDLNKEKCENIMANIIETNINDINYGILNENQRNRYLAKRLQRISNRSAWTLIQHLSKGKFKPLGYEWKFARDGELPAIEIDLPNHKKIYIEGRIDRIDYYDEKDTRYIKIIDYKTSKRDLSFAEIYHGLSLQLLIYLKAALQENKAIIGYLKPAGVFYFKIADPLIRSESQDLDLIEEEITKQFKMNGLVLEDINIAKMMDADISSSSSIIPAGIKNDNTFSAVSSVIKDEHFSSLLNYLELLLKRANSEIITGKICIEPIKYRDFTACTYCSYQSICQFDRLLARNDFRILPVLNKEKVIELISTKSGGDTNETVD